MADENEEGRKRRRIREDEVALEEELQKSIKGQEDYTRIKYSIEKFDDLILRASPMIQQVNNLYNMFALGVEKAIPQVRREQLDQLMVAIQMAHKPTQASLFKFHTIQAQYFVHKEKWEKMLKDVENGKIKRRLK